MRNLGLLAGIAMLVLAPSAASAADTGAQPGVPMQAGSAWGHPAAMPGGPGYAAPYRAAPHWTNHAGYRRPVPGWRVPRPYRDRGYWVNDWRGWGLREPGPGMVWVRYYDDALLIDASGRVVDCRYGVDWDHGYGAYAGGPGYGYPPPGAYPAPAYPAPVPAVTHYRAGPDTTVTTTVTPLGVPASYVVGGCGACGGTVVTVTPGVAVTTTTTTTSYETIYRKAAVRRRIVRKHRYRKPRCVKMTCPIQGS